MLKINLGQSDDDKQQTAEKQKLMEKMTKSNSLDRVYNPDISAYEKKKYGAEIPQEEARWVKEEITKRDIEEILKYAEENFAELKQEFNQQLSEFETSGSAQAGNVNVDHEDYDELQNKIFEQTFSIAQRVKIAEIDALDKTDEAKNAIRSGVFGQLQLDLDAHFDEVFPPVVFEVLDELMDEDDSFDELKVASVISYIYMAVMGKGVSQYIDQVLPDIVEKTITNYDRLLEMYRIVFSLPEDDQQKFVELMQEDKFNEAEEFVRSKMPE